MLKKPIANTLAQVIGKSVMVAISLVTTGILTRKLGVSVYGSFTLVSSIFILLDSLADFGTKIIAVREASGKNEDKQKEVFFQTSWLRLLISTLAFGIGLVLIFSWNGFAEIRWESIIALSMIWFTSLAGSLEIVFQTRIRMDLKVLMDILFPVLFLLTLTIWPDKITLAWVFTVYLGARIISLMAGFKLLRIINIRWEWPKISLNQLKGLLKESWPMGLYLIIFAGYDRAVDSMIIRHYWTAADVAFYGLAYKIYSNLVQPAYYFVNSIFPLLSSNASGKKRLFGLSALILSSVILAAIPFIFILSPWIIQVLAGNNFAPSVAVLRILIIALFFSYIEHLVGFTLISRGKQKDILFFGLVALAVNISANLLIIPRYGIVGAAWVTCLTEAVACALMTFRLFLTSKR